MSRLLGRACPVHYRYSPKVLSPALAGSNPTLPPSLDCVYVVGGLYGNSVALESLKEVVDKDVSNRGMDWSRVRIVFNGDFNWFNGVRRDSFVSLNHAIMSMEKEEKAICLAGNIEVELGVKVEKNSGPRGCGCAYPSYVSDSVVSNSDEIMANFFKLTADTDTLNGSKPDKEISDIVDWLGNLPYHCRLRVGMPNGSDGLDLGVVHGDATSLAGWHFAVEAMPPFDDDVSTGGGRNMEFTDPKLIGKWFQLAQVDCFACTHTCLPFMQDFYLSIPQKKKTLKKIIVNNGSAGMPNFREDVHSGHGGVNAKGEVPVSQGIISRVSVPPNQHHENNTSHPTNSFQYLYGTKLNGIHIDALAFPFDKNEHIRQFVQDHPVNSPAYNSYYKRILAGPNFLPDEANRLNR